MQAISCHLLGGWIAWTRSGRRAKGRRLRAAIVRLLPCVGGSWLFCQNPPTTGNDFLVLAARTQLREVREHQAAHVRVARRHLQVAAELPAVPVVRVLVDAV